MTQLIPMLLICALGKQPVECNPYTARSVMRGDAVASTQQCLMQATALGKSLTLADDEYPKIMCPRRNEQ